MSSEDSQRGAPAAAMAPTLSTSTFESGTTIGHLCSKQSYEMDVPDQQMRGTGWDLEVLDESTAATGVCKPSSRSGEDASSNTGRTISRPLEDVAVESRLLVSHGSLWSGALCRPTDTFDASGGCSDEDMGPRLLGPSASCKAACQNGRYLGSPGVPAAHAIARSGSLCKPAEQADAPERFYDEALTFGPPIGPSQNTQQLAEEVRWQTGQEDSFAGEVPAEAGIMPPSAMVASHPRSPSSLNEGNAAEDEPQKCRIRGQQLFDITVRHPGAARYAAAASTTAGAAGVHTFASPESAARTPIASHGSHFAEGVHTFALPESAAGSPTASHGGHFAEGFQSVLPAIGWSGSPSVQRPVGTRQTPHADLLDVLVWPEDGIPSASRSPSRSAPRSISRPGRQHREGYPPASPRSPRPGSPRIFDGQAYSPKSPSFYESDNVLLRI